MIQASDDARSSFHLEDLGSVGGRHVKPVREEGQHIRWALQQIGDGKDVQQVPYTQRLVHRVVLCLGEVAGHALLLDADNEVDECGYHGDGRHPKQRLVRLGHLGLRYAHEVVDRAEPLRQHACAGPSHRQQLVSSLIKA